MTDEQDRVKTKLALVIRIFSEKNQMFIFNISRENHIFPIGLHTDGQTNKVYRNVFM